MMVTNDENGPHILKATFTPNDKTRYREVQATVNLNVKKSTFEYHKIKINLSTANQQSEAHMQMLVNRFFKITHRNSMKFLNIPK
jgi:hypothetical protein